MLTHVDQNNRPTMVDITEKSITTRVASATSKVQLPEVIGKYLNGNELNLKKGPVFQTAIIAGTMATKKTYEIIPFCHQIPIESCKITITIDASFLVTIDCTVKTTFKTGVEMEALNGAMTAALTIYDMCKAISHDITILETKINSKTGGKRTILDKPLYGLILTGGKSQRMKSDKALLNYKGTPQAKYLFDILKNHCSEVYLSARADQWVNTELENLPTITDTIDGVGPLSGIYSAMQKHSDSYWMVVACDLPFFNDETLNKLISSFNKDKVATAFKNNEKDFPEALCAIYTPKSLEIIKEAIANNIHCPVKILKNSDIELIEQTGNINLANINTPDEYQEVLNEIR